MIYIKFKLKNNLAAAKTFIAIRLFEKWTLSQINIFNHNHLQTISFARYSKEDLQFQCVSFMEEQNKDLDGNTGHGLNPSIDFRKWSYQICQRCIGTYLKEMSTMGYYKELKSSHASTQVRSQWEFILAVTGTSIKLSLHSMKLSFYTNAEVEITRSMLSQLLPKTTTATPQIAILPPTIFHQVL